MSVWQSESEPDEDLPKLVAERYEVLRKIGEGGGGVVHLGRDKYSGNEVAIKLHANDDDAPDRLQHEAQVMAMMAGRLGIPRLYLFAREPHHTALVTELLGGNLHALHGYCSGQFSLKTVLMVAEQAITLLETVHSAGLVHRDVKLSNFIMGLGNLANQIHIIDFGLCKPYRIEPGHVHIPARTHKHLVGTPDYCSVNLHLGHEYSRRDDLESLAYSLIQLATGRPFPWHGIKGLNIKQRLLHVQYRKQHRVTQLCHGLPDEFRTFLEYTRNLAFEERPNYRHGRAIFRTLFEREGYEDDDWFDWNVITAERNAKRAAKRAAAAAANSDTHVNPEPRDLEKPPDRNNHLADSPPHIPDHSHPTNPFSFSDNIWLIVGSLFMFSVVFLWFGYHYRLFPRHAPLVPHAKSF